MVEVQIARAFDFPAKIQTNIFLEQNKNTTYTYNWKTRVFLSEKFNWVTQDIRSWINNHDILCLVEQECSWQNVLPNEILLLLCLYRLYWNPKSWVLARCVEWHLAKGNWQSPVERYSFELSKAKRLFEYYLKEYWENKNSARQINRTFVFSRIESNFLTDFEIVRLDFGLIRIDQVDRLVLAIEV